jgi:hypothetical protein
MTTGQRTSQRKIKAILCLYVCPILLFLILSALAQNLLSVPSAKPILLGWSFASINFAAALWSYSIAQKSQLIPSMLLVFGGGGLRMLLMISGIFVVMLKKAEWMLPFSSALLICFVAYLIIEVGVIHRRGLLTDDGYLDS